MSIPSSFRLPSILMEVSDSGVGASGTRQLVELVGPSLSSAGQHKVLSSADHAASLFGVGSVLHRMAMRAFEAAPYSDIAAIGVADAGAATKAKWTATVTVMTAAAGTIRLWVGSDYVDIGVTAGELQGDVAAAIAAAFPAVSAYPVVGTVNSNVASLEFRHGGTVGNDLPVFLDRSLSLPSGVSVVVTQSVVGATDPTLTAAIAAMEAVAPDKIALWNDAMTVAIGAEMDLRWGYDRAQLGTAYLATRCTAGEHDPTGYTAELTAVQSAAQPYYRIGVVKLPYLCRAPSYEVAASMAATCARSDEADPGLTVHGLTLTGCRGADADVDFSPAQRNSLLYYGCTTCGQSGGYLTIDRARTTRYQTSTGIHDERMTDMTRIWLTEWYIRYRQQVMAATFGRCRLLDTTGRLPANCASPEMVRATEINVYRRAVELGYADGLDEFADALVVEIDPTDPNRINSSLPLSLANGLEILAGVISYT